MSLLEDLGKTDDIKKGGDFVGFKRLESGIYPAIIKMAYQFKKPTGSIGIAVEFFLPSVKKTHKEDFYIKSGNAKGNKIFYIDRQTGDKKFIPGYEMMDNICLLTNGKPLVKQTTSEKLVKIYDFDQSKEVPKKVPVLTKLLDKKVNLGIVRNREYKVIKDDSGNDIQTSEIRDNNTTNAVFHTTTNCTESERSAKKEATYYVIWQDRWEGEINDKTDSNKTSSIMKEESHNVPVIPDISSDDDNIDLFND